MTINVLLVDDDSEVRSMFLLTHNTKRKEGAPPSPINAIVCDPEEYPHPFEEKVKDGVFPDVVVIDYGMPIKPEVILEQIGLTYAQRFPSQKMPQVIVCSGMDADEIERVMADIRANLESKGIFFPSYDALSKATYITPKKVGEAIQKLVAKDDNKNEQPVLLNGTPVADIQIPTVTIDDAINACRAYTGGAIDEDRLSLLVEAMKAEEILHPFYSTVVADEKQKAQALSFDDSTGDSIKGVAVFTSNPEDVEEIHKKYPDQPAILITNDGGAETIKNLSLFDALVVIGGDHQSHLKTNTRGSALILGAEKDGFSLDMANKTLLRQEEPFLTTGSTLTLDTHNRLLFKGALPIKEAGATSQAFQNLAAFIQNHRDYPDDAYFSYHVDTRADREQCKGRIGLSRMESAFLNKKNLHVLRDSIRGFAPKGSVRRAVRDHYASLFEGSTERYEEPVVRLIDFKPDQILKDYKNHQSSYKNMRGFFGFADKHADLCLEMCEGMLEIMSQKIEKGSVLRIIVPDAQSAKQLIFAKELIQKAKENVPAAQDIEIAVGAMIESKEAVRNTREILSELAKGHPNVPIALKIGGSDLATDLISTAESGKIERHDYQGIREWMKGKDGYKASPFFSLFPALRKSLEKVMRDVAGFKEHEVAVDFCGLQATNPEVCYYLEKMGITASIPSRAIYTKGFPLFRGLKSIKDAAAARNLTGPTQPIGRTSLFTPKKIQLT